MDGLVRDPAGNPLGSAPREFLSLVSTVTLLEYSELSLCLHTSTMVVNSCFVSVKVQVTLPPAARVKAAGVLFAPVQVELLRSQPEGTVSATL